MAPDLEGSVRVWTGFNWHKTGSIGQLLRTRYWTLGFHNRWNISTNWETISFSRRSPFHIVTYLGRTENLNWWRCISRRNKDQRLNSVFYETYGTSASQHLNSIEIRGCISKFPDWIDNEINNNNKHSLRSNTKAYLLTYLLTYIMKLGVRWVGYVARTGETRNAYRILMGNRLGKRPLRRPRRRWDCSIKIDLRKVIPKGMTWKERLRIMSSGGICY
jgi:hypothetical protein